MTMTVTMNMCCVHRIGAHTRTWTWTRTHILHLSAHLNFIGNQEVTNQREKKTIYSSSTSIQFEKGEKKTQNPKQIKFE